MTHHSNLGSESHTEVEIRCPQSLYCESRATANIIHPSFKMSRFFTQGDSSSESSSSDEEELYSGEEDGQKDEKDSSEEEEASEEEESSSSEEEGKTGASKFLREAESSDESDDEDKVTVVKSAKDKRLEELESVVRVIENAIKINDWSSISTGRSKELGVCMWSWLSTGCRVR